MGLPSLSEEAFLDATSTTTVCGQVLYEPTFTWFGWGGGFAGGRMAMPEMMGDEAMVSPGGGGGGGGSLRIVAETSVALVEGQVCASPLIITRSLLVYVLFSLETRTIVSHLRVASVCLRGHRLRFHSTWRSCLSTGARAR